MWGYTTRQWIKENEILFVIIQLGNKPDGYLNLFSEGKTVAYIPNATDFTGADPSRVKAHIKYDVDGLEELGLDVEVLDLKDYFDQPQTNSARW